MTNICVYIFWTKSYILKMKICLKEAKQFMVYSKEIVREWLDEVAERAKDHPEWVDVFERCYTDTLDNTV